MHTCANDYFLTKRIYNYFLHFNKSTIMITFCIFLMRKTKNYLVFFCYVLELNRRINDRIESTLYCRRISEL